jgi:hypothetical protein
MPINGGITEASLVTKVWICLPVRKKWEYQSVSNEFLFCRIAVRFLGVTNKIARRNLWLNFYYSLNLFEGGARYI